MNPSMMVPYRQGDSRLHRLDARLKLPLTLGFIVVCALLPTGAWPLMLALELVLLVLAQWGGPGAKLVLIRSLLSLPFVAAALPLLVTLPGQTMLAMPFGWAISDAGLLRFGSLVLKSWVSVQAAILLSSTTSLPDLLLALRFLRLPALLVAVMGMMWRYLELMINEVQRMLRARAARSGSLPGGRRSGGSLWWRSQVAGGMAGSLMVRSLERSERVYAAMLARGYDGEVRSLPRPGLNRRQKWMLLTGGLVLGLAALLGNIFWK